MSDCTSETGPTPDGVVRGPYASHEAGKAAVERALDGWFTAMFADLTALAGARLPVAPETVVVFDAHVRHDSHEHEHWREELLSLTIVNGSGETLLAAGDRDWEAATALWDAIRSALTVAYSAAIDDVGTGLVVDLDAQTIAMWEPYFCPDDGNLPVGLFDLRARFADPFEALLASDTDYDDLEDRIIDLITGYDIAPPTRAAHAPGECGTFEPDTTD